MYDSLEDTGGRLSTSLRGRLTSALHNGDLKLHYQPQVDLQRSIMTGCEALVRWHDPRQGWISPELFVPVAEGSDQRLHGTCIAKFPQRPGCRPAHVPLPITQGSDQWLHGSCVAKRAQCYGCFQAHASVFIS